MDVITKELDDSFSTEIDEDKNSTIKNEIDSSIPSKIDNEDNNVKSFIPLEKGASASSSSATTKRENPENFSSENFKICIHNLPRHVDSKALKKLMKKLELDVRKAYVVRDHAFVCFADESTVDRAMTLLKNYTWKKNILRAKRAAPSVDPILAGATKSKKQKTNFQRQPKKEDDVEDDDSNLEEDQKSDLSPEDRLLDAVAPLCKIPYVDQLASKQKESEVLLKEISQQMIYVVDRDRSVVPICGYFGELKSILPSPIIDGYRNKCEFSIGYDCDRSPTIGFRLTRYKAGSTALVSPDNCPHLPEMTKKIVKIFQKFVADSPLPPFDVTSRIGFWSMLTVRQFLMDTMVIVQVYEREKNDEQMESMKKSLVDLFSTSLQQDGVRVTSLYFQRLQQASDAPVYEHLSGVPYVYENVLGLRFRISPGAFFQVNTPACEILYKNLADICRVDDETLLVDLCCGTGTIGIVLASGVGKVIGIESCVEAVDDARINAKNNERANCEFICGKVENHIEDLRRRTTQYKRVVGVLDPPRGGLPGKVLSCIRLFLAMKTVVYVSCNPTAATKNFLDLTRRSSNRYPGEPFRLKTVQPVDMFPHTKHCEWILVFER